MNLYVGIPIAEFNENPEVEGGYTSHLKRLLLAIGKYPANGSWQIICLGDNEEMPEISEDEIEAGAKSGKYVVGGYNIVKHEAQLPDEKNPQIL